jgi:NADH-quinone oxidoreductase subunit M
VVLGALYMLWMFQRVMFGPLKNPANERLADLTTREGLVFVPLLILIFWIGFNPQPILDRAQPALERTMQLVQQRSGMSGTADNVGAQR